MVYYAGGDEDPDDPLLNPAHVLLAARAPNPAIARIFMKWMANPNGGQAVVKSFMVDGQPLYSPAP